MRFWRQQVHPVSVSRRSVFASLFVMNREISDKQLARALKGKIRLYASDGVAEITPEYVDEYDTKLMVAAGLSRHVLYRENYIPEKQLGCDLTWYTHVTRQSLSDMKDALGRLQRRDIFYKIRGGVGIPLHAVTRAVQHLNSPHTLLCQHRVRRPRRRSRRRVRKHKRQR